MKSRNWRRPGIASFLALAVTLPLALGACDGGDSTTGPPPQQQPPPQQPPPPGPSFDFSGDLVIFRRQINQRQDLYMAKADGSQTVNLTDSPFADSDPAWSPDGSKIAFVSTRSGKSEVYTMNVDGSNVTRITNDPCETRWPEWSSDGSRILFSSLRANARHIYEIDAAGPNSANEVQRTNVGSTNDRPARSAIGKIFFYSTRSGCGDIWVMNADGSEQVNLTNLCPTLDIAPAALHKLSWTSTRDGVEDIFVSELDGSNPTNLTNHSARDVNSSWRHDGERLVFASERDGRFQIYSMNADGTDVVRLTNANADDLMPRWRPSTGNPSIRGALSGAVRAGEVAGPAAGSAPIPPATFIRELSLPAPSELDALQALSAPGGSCE